MQIKPRQLLLAVCVSATVALTGLTGCHTEGERTQGRALDDRMVEHRVKKALADDPLYKFPDVKVQTFAGVVQLSGFVDSQEQKQMAAQIAQHVEGVHEVINGLVLKPQAARQAPPGTPTPTGYPTGQRIDADTAPPVNAITNTPPAPVTTPENAPQTNPNQKNQP